MRRLVEDQCAGLFTHLLQTRLAPRRLGGQKTLEDKPVRRQPRSRQCGDQGARPRHRNHGDARSARLAHQMITRIGNQRCTGIGNQRNAVTCQQAGDEAATLLTLIVLVTRSKWRLDAKVLEQPNGVPGVFGSNQGHVGEHLQGACTHVVKITNGRCHHIKCASRGIRNTRYSHSTHLVNCQRRHCTASCVRVETRSRARAGPETFCNHWGNAAKLSHQ